MSCTLTHFLRQKNRNNRIRLSRISAIIFCALPLLAGCKSITTTPTVVADSGQRWALLPIENLSVTPLAGARASNMVETQLRRRGVALLANYADSATSAQQDLATLLNSRAEMERAKQWARSNGYRYAVTGSVNEWHYKTGTDKEPAVGLNLKVIDLPTGLVIWQGTGSRTGWGYSNLARIGEKVANDLVSEMSIERQSVVSTPSLAAALPGTISAGPARASQASAPSAQAPAMQPRIAIPSVNTPAQSEPSLGAAAADTPAADYLPRLQIPSFSSAPATSTAPVGENVELPDVSAAVPAIPAAAASDSIDQLLVDYSATTPSTEVEGGEVIVLTSGSTTETEAPAGLDRLIITEPAGYDEYQAVSESPTPAQGVSID